MNLQTALSAHIGKQVEVFTQNEFYTGVLERVEKGFITVRGDSSYYYGPTDPINIAISAISYIRILVN